jgi:hypothetical protein
MECGKVSAGGHPIKKAAIYRDQHQPSAVSQGWPHQRLSMKIIAVSEVSLLVVGLSNTIINRPNLKAGSNERPALSTSLLIRHPPIITTESYGQALQKHHPSNPALPSSDLLLAVANL